jgi:hypothetical protein
MPSLVWVAEHQRILRHSSADACLQASAFSRPNLVRKSLGRLAAMDAIIRSLTSIAQPALSKNHFSYTLVSFKYFHRLDQSPVFQECISGGTETGAELVLFFLSRIHFFFSSFGVVGAGDSSLLSITCFGLMVLLFYFPETKWVIASSCSPFLASTTCDDDDGRRRL